jgi:hypothetical protein
VASSTDAAVFSASQVRVFLFFFVFCVVIFVILWLPNVASSTVAAVFSAAQLRFFFSFLSVFYF